MANETRKEGLRTEGSLAARGASPTAVDVGRVAGPSRAMPLDAHRVYAVGRDEDADIYFESDGVSRVHAHLKCEAGRWVLFDAHSSNGTFLTVAEAAPSEAVRDVCFAASRRLTPGEKVALSVGDVVFLGGAGASLFMHAAALRSVAPATGGRSARGRRFEHDLRAAGRGYGPVLLIGRSGSGKTWAAERIHHHSARAGAFVSLNAAALPDDKTTLRSVLLGHKRGAFTGAHQDQPGAWAAADGGTFFLDEIDSLGAAGQAFLLTLLEQSGDLAPLGAPPSAETKKRDVRVIASSKTPLAQSGLREDLAYRLVDGAVVEIPALAERRDDVPVLVADLLEALRQEDGAAVPLSAAALALCQQAAWPGEMRQLKSLVRVLSRQARDAGVHEVDATAVQARLDAVQRALGGPVDGATSSAPSAPVAAARRGGVDAAPQKKARDLNGEDIRAALAACEGNIQHAARALGIARGTLVTKMDRFGIERPGRR